MNSRQVCLFWTIVAAVAAGLGLAAVIATAHVTLAGTLGAATGILLLWACVIAFVWS